jgi:hypothetical protein
MATRRQVERKLTELIRRLDEAGADVHGSLGEALPEPRTIRVDVSDLGLAYWTDLAGGRMGELHQGEPPVTHIRVQAGSDHLVEMIDGRRSLFSAYLSGQIRIEASFSDLMRLRKLA